ncbi:MAG: bifunctional UDP-N-acetylglucosamine diphosphorylase/glucosamine-1-phosphate N-acetyltransferase GlmU [Nitrospirae bacterium]|nr:bifunctional UDP-N-acetylglucosamine diphosphorylase/glucosamine-1-phosphate N-acetyltransferase GlmU [Nitrospirota bacterium]
MKLAVVVLAAGRGKRMNSNVPKVLHRIFDKPMLQYVLDSSSMLRPSKILIVVGKHQEDIKNSVKNRDVSFVMQKEPKGTAHALRKAVMRLKGFKGTIIVLNGDAPLITAKTLRRLLMLHRNGKNDISFISFIAGSPAAYGRVLRDKSGNVRSIIEEKDANKSQKNISEVNSGIYAFEADALKLLEDISMNKLKGEYYLTDIIGIARDRGLRVKAYCIGSEAELMGINTATELLKARQMFRERIINKWIETGVIFLDPDSVFVFPHVIIGKDTIIYPDVYLEGKTKIGKGCILYPNVRINDSIVKDRAVIKDSTIIESSLVRENAVIGPFAHLRPGCDIGAEAKIGNFVEVKKSVIGKKTKASHLSYLGDASIGESVNIGAGTITCNYDGKGKHRTIIEDNVFIGSDTQLVAPVSVGKSAYIGAGSTITKDIPSMSLAISRVEQRNIDGWVSKKIKVKSSKLKVLS